MAPNCFRTLDSGKQHTRIEAGKLQIITSMGTPQAEEHAQGKRKQRVLVLTDWYLPGNKAGGPVKSVSSMVNRLKEEFEFFILTTDRDLGDSKPYDKIESDCWIKVEDHLKVFYCSKRTLSFFCLRKIMRSTDVEVIYLNSFFSKCFSVYPLLFKKLGWLSKPLVLAPRGMLGKGALEIKSFKKNIFIACVKMIGLHKKIKWHSTSEQETEEIKEVFGKGADIRYAPNFPSVITESLRQTEKMPGEIRLFFLSRISEKKNLLYAIELLNQVKNCKIVFDIFGPIEDQVYWRRCISLVKRLPSSVEVNYKGVLNEEDLSITISQYHFLLLPTRNENFGHVIFESLCCACPVIISDQTPWKNLANELAGIEISLDNPSQFISSIEKYASMNENTYLELSNGAKDLARLYLKKLESSISLYLTLFKQKT